MREAPGFTLIELSIVLVIIGLIAGGILVGRDLVKAAEVRAQISQVEKYHQAVNTFKVKFGALPGDMPASTAAQFGFSARGQYAGEGDGNGLIEGVASNGGSVSGSVEGEGETVMLWVDLSSPAAGNLIDGNFSTASFTALPGGVVTPTSSPNLDAYFPQAKLGNGNYVYAWSFKGINYFGVSAVTNMNFGGHGYMTSSAITPARQAYVIDTKIDDGLPTTGGVLTIMIGDTASLNTNPVYPGDFGLAAYGGPPMPTGSGYAFPQSTTSCFDNGGNNAVTVNYSMGPAANYGNNGNCALSFRFQ